MAKKRTKFDKLQRNAERFDKREDARRESEITDKGSKPAEAEPEILRPQRKAGAA